MRGHLRAAEFVLPGHPDKLCDAIADGLVQAAAKRERRALVGVEVAVHRSAVFVTGRIACVDAETIDIPGIVRQIFASAGYSSDWRPAPDDLQVHVDVCVGPLTDGESEFRSVSDDQSIVTGYACDSAGTNYLPPEHWLAAQVGRRLGALSRRPELGLGPDGKVLVVVQDDGDVQRLARLSTSVQQVIGGPAIDLHRAVYEVVADELVSAARSISGLDVTVPATVMVNGAGDFAVGGPHGDNGLSGKKLVVDAYGPRVPIGGGALSGKDLYKADRAGALLARRLAKAVVWTGAARTCLTTLAVSPGDSRAEILRLEDESGAALDRGRWERLFDLSLAGIGDRFTDSADLVRVAREGHFMDATLPWERLSFDLVI